MTTLQILLIGGGSITSLVVLGALVVRNAEERGRRRSENAATAPGAHRHLGDDAALVEHHQQHVSIARAETQELRRVAVVRRRKVTRRPVRWQRQVAARRRLAPGSFEADPLRAEAVAVPLERPVVLGGLVEPAPWLLESFTEEWTTAEFAALIEAARAGATR